MRFCGSSLLVKKLQAELEAEHQYCAALEAHLRTFRDHNLKGWPDSISTALPPSLLL